MLIIDAHLDIAWNALQWNRNLLDPVYSIRVHEKNTPGKARATGTVAFPDMQKGRIALSFATVLARSTGQPVPHVDFASTAQAYAIAQGQLAYYRALERDGYVRIVSNAAQLDAHISAWTAWEGSEAENGNDAPALGFVISMEGADPIVDPDDLPEWWQAGLRVLGPTHYGPGRYAGGTGTEVGLSAPGERLLSQMDQLGLILDLTHFSDKAFWQALERFDGPVLASHNNCRALVPHQRQFSDEQIRAIVNRNGVIGCACDAWMLRPGWITGHSTNEKVTLGDVADHIDYICQLAGSSRHAAIGSDLDGGFGREQSPRDLDTIADLQKLIGLLADRGYTDADVAAIMHGNWVRLLRQSWSDGFNEILTPL